MLQQSYLVVLINENSKRRYDYEKTISISLIVLLLALLALPAYAAETEPQSDIGLKFTHIWSMGASLNITSTGKAECEGFVNASSDEYTAVLTVTLQKSTGSGWTNLKSWEGSGSGHSGLIVGGNYFVGRGTYRVCVTANIYSSSGALLETASYYSVEKTY